MVPIDVGADLVDRLARDRARRGVRGAPRARRRGRHGPGAARGDGIPYTGSGVSACIRTADKVLAKHAMRDRGIPTPDFYAFNETAFRELGAAQALPAIEERLRVPDRGQARGAGIGARDQVRAHAGGRAGRARRGLLVRPQGAARALRVRAGSGGLDHRRGRASRGRFRSSRRCPRRRTSTTSRRATRSGARGSCAPPS